MTAVILSDSVIEQLIQILHSFHVALETVTNQYLGGDTSLACSQEMAADVDRRVVEVVKTQYSKAMNLLQENVGKLHELSKYLYEKETITGEEFMEILNK